MNVFPRFYRTLKHDTKKGLFFALSGLILVSTNYITAKYALGEFNPHTFSMIWTFAATFYSLMIILSSGQIRQTMISRHSLIYMIILGTATGAGMILGWAGLALLDPSFTSFLWRFAPAVTIILSVILLKEKMYLWEILPITLMIIGGAVSTIGQWHIVGTGVILTVSACITVAVQMVVAKAKVIEIHPNILVFYRVGIAWLLISIYTIATGNLDFHASIGRWVVLGIGAFLGPCASFLLTFRSFQYWGLNRTSIIRTTQPLFVLPMAFLAFRKMPNHLQLMGGFVILIGAFWLAILHRNKKE